MPRIFLSYRREESSGHAGRLHDDLTKHFGSQAVFMDVTHMNPGDDFVRVLEDKLSSCDVLIALIR